MSKVERSDALVLFGATSVTVLEQLVERYGPEIVALLPLRLRLALATTIGTAKLVHAADLIEHRTADAQTGVALEGDAALRIETVDRVDEADNSGGLEVVGAGDRADRHVHAVGDA